MSEYIPLEVQEEIWKRLPVKPLIRFRWVSKPWKSLIDSPGFIAAYGVRETHPNCLILRYKDKTDGKEKYLIFVDNENDHSFTRQDFVPTVPDLIKTLGSSSVVGLLCFTGYYYKYLDGHFCKVIVDRLQSSTPLTYQITEMVVLWNLSISKSIGIEVPCMGGLPINHVIGFGVCPHTLDPTILKIEIFRIGSPCKVEVFTLNTGTWSILSTNLNSGSFRLFGSQVVVGRFIYWLALDKLVAEDGFNFQPNSQKMILSFDLTTKEFKEIINLSDSLTRPLCRIQTISKLRESLVLLEYHREFEEDLLVRSLWMMKEQGLNKLFTKLYNINLLPDLTINKILGFRKTGELILETLKGFEGHAEVQIYDPNSETIDNIALLGVECRFFMCSYMETTLLLDQLNGFIYSISH
uniref:putative F-box protein At3g16210 n=1 Tax=Erigeron canadensis TaxID=72917 RepID=UPI001CB8A0B2|nr:putative F-box protein At3g16210 [Erigeron canadensis]